MMKPDSISAQSSRRSPIARISARRHHGRASRFGEQLADDRAEADDHRHKPQRVADAGLKRPRDLRQRHARRQPDNQRCRRKREKRRHAEPDDEDDDEGNTEGGDDEERSWIQEQARGSELTSGIAPANCAANCQN